MKELQTLFKAGTFTGLSDGQLMERFANGDNDSAAAAFTALLGRHGPMVLRVCLQVLGDSHDAQDAFQATFLVLVRKTGSVRKYDSVASWLYGVAQRVATRAKMQAGRRELHERRRSALMELKSVDQQTTWSETWSELHEEVASLPEKLRVPIVLCYLEGLTTEAAARQLGCPRGTVLSRLSRARERLRERLTRRGVSYPSVLWIAGLTPHASTSVPDSLTHTTVQAAMQITVGKSATGTAPASVAALVEGVLVMMLRSSLTRVAWAVFAVSVMTVGVCVLVSRTAGAPPQTTTADQNGPENHLAQAGNEPAGQIVVRAFNLSRGDDDDELNGVAAIDPTTGKWRTISKGLALGPGPVSPDGRYIVYSSLGPDPDPDQVGIWIYDKN